MLLVKNVLFIHTITCKYILLCICVRIQRVHQKNPRLQAYDYTKSLDLGLEFMPYLGPILGLGLMTGGVQPHLAMWQTFCSLFKVQMDLASTKSCRHPSHTPYCMFISLHVQKGQAPWGTFLPFPVAFSFPCVHLYSFYATPAKRIQRLASVFSSNKKEIAIFLQHSLLTAMAAYYMLCRSCYILLLCSIRLPV